MYIGIIDILQSYRLKEQTNKFLYVSYIKFVFNEHTPHKHYPFV